MPCNSHKAFMNSNLPTLVIPISCKYFFPKCSLNQWSLQHIWIYTNICIRFIIHFNNHPSANSEIIFYFARKILNRFDIRSSQSQMTRSQMSISRNKFVIPRCSNKGMPYPASRKCVIARSTGNITRSNPKCAGAPIQNNCY
ncbi:MAG: hypothetical protein DDT23_01260 [candidate division WS2 bacterium]|nr:hypothetical protein [Candidatus Lithacetigena glycinireducens]